MVRLGKFSKGVLEWNNLAPGLATHYPGPIRIAYGRSTAQIGGPATGCTVVTGLQSVIWGWPTEDESLEVCSTTGGNVVLYMVQGSYYTPTHATHGVFAFGY